MVGLSPSTPSIFGWKKVSITLKTLLLIAEELMSALYIELCAMALCCMGVYVLVAEYIFHLIFDSTIQISTISSKGI